MRVSFILFIIGVLGVVIYDIKMNPPECPAGISEGMVVHHATGIKGYVRHCEHSWIRVSTGLEITNWDYDEVLEAQQ